MMANQTIFELVCRQAECLPDKTAVIVENKSISYSELTAMVLNIAAQLEGAGVKPQDKIGVVLPNSLEFVVFMLAVSRLGCVIVPHCTSTGMESLRNAFVAADVSHCIVFSARIAAYQQALSDVINGCFFVFGSESAESSRSDMQACDNGPVLLDIAASMEVPQFSAEHQVSPDLPFIMTVTSGSTGTPKPIVLSQATKIRRANSAISVYGVSGADVTMASTPLYHSLAQRLVLIPLISGGTCVLLARYSPSAWLAAVREHAVTFTIAVASQLVQLEQALSSGDHACDSLRCLVSSSERLDPNLKKRLSASLRCQFHECYGASEAAIVTNLSASGEKVPLDSVGTPLPEVEVRIIDDSGIPVMQGEVGEIACKTPMIFSGYYNMPEMTEASFRDGYFCTGDLGYLDGDGNLHYVGRKKELIIVGGINVYPRDIEQVILGLPGVAECAVTGRQSEQFNEEPVAFIVPGPGVQLSKREIQRACLDNLADFQQPREIFLVEGLPRNTVGKVVKRALFDALKNNQIKKIA